MNDFPIICTATPPRTPARHTANTWPAPDPTGPGTPGWDSAQLLRLGEFCEHFQCYTIEAFAWLGYLTGESHARPILAPWLTAGDERVVA